MIVDEQRLPFPQNGRPITTGHAASGEPVSQSECQQQPPEGEDELPIAFVPPPIMLTRVFPGL